MATKIKAGFIGHYSIKECEKAERKIECKIKCSLTDSDNKVNIDKIDAVFNNYK